MEFGFPELTDSFLAGQDILYTQFNDVEFYVEDTRQEHFYFNILKKLFIDIEFKKIFPLNGKKNVGDAAKLNAANKKKIYIVDLDFDEILNSKETAPNLFYLDRYSIENHLFSKRALFEIIRERNPKLKDIDIEALIDYQGILKKSKILLTELACCFVLIKKHALGIEYFGINPARDFDFSESKQIYRNTSIIMQYFLKVEQALKSINNRFTLKGEVNKLKRHFGTIEKALANIPGKYILLLIKYTLEKLSLIWQMDLESLSYKLAKEIDPIELNYLKVCITNYRS